MPTPSEWASFWGLATLTAAVVAAYLALAQLRQNARAAEEQVRPFVVVDLAFRSTLVSIEVRNTGQTAAVGIKLNWSEIPVISEPARSAAFQRNLVDKPIPFLAPGRSIRYLIGRFADYPETAPRVFEVDARYKGPDEKLPWASTSILDLDQWAQALADSDYDNKNWNESKLQSAAQQKMAAEFKKAAESLDTVAEFIELQPRMKLLRAQEHADWEASFGPELIDIPAVTSAQALLEENQTEQRPPGLSGSAVEELETGHGPAAT